MSDDQSTQETQDIPAVIEEARQTDPGGQSPLEAHAASEEPGRDPLPAVAAAFVGGLVFARVLKRLGGGGDE